MFEEQNRGSLQFDPWEQQRAVRKSGVDTRTHAVIYCLGDDGNGGTDGIACFALDPRNALIAFVKREKGGTFSVQDRICASKVFPGKYYYYDPDMRCTFAAYPV